MVQAPTTWTIRRLLEWTPGFFQKKGVDQPRLSAELLLSHVLNLPRIQLYTSYERVVDDAKLAEYRALVQRAAEQEPIAYLTGKAHFFSLEFQVTRDVLIPRSDTETLVENVLQTARNQAGLEAPRVLDLCTGSGCVAAAIAKNLKAATVLAVDISEPAVAIAQKNIEALGLSDRVMVEQGDLFEPIKKVIDPRPFAMIVANPPYIPSGQIAGLDKSVKDFEPISALDGGEDGLDLHRRIITGAMDHLEPGGRLFMEIAFDQGPAAEALFAGQIDFEEVRLLKDYGGRHRVVTARRKA